jgi:hypothetical protein
MATVSPAEASILFNVESLLGGRGRVAWDYTAPAVAGSRKGRRETGREGGAMAKSKSRSIIRWLKEPEEHDYPAAQSYLELLYPTSSAQALVKKLEAAPVSRFKAKDIFRASGLSLLGVSNSHVERDQRKIAAGSGLSPLLLVRDPARGAVVIADGYHRLCAVYAVDEDSVIPCKIV